MIIKVKPEATEEQIAEVLAILNQLGERSFPMLAGRPRIIVVAGVPDNEVLKKISGLEGVEKLMFKGGNLELPRMQEPAVSA